LGGIGEAKAPDSFRKACSAFVELDLRTAGEKHSSAPPPVRPLTEIERQVTDVLRSLGDATGYPIAKLGAHMHAHHRVQISQQPEKTWRAWLQARPDRFVCEPKGPEARVRLKA
jgi:hypothetical protein